MERLYPGYTDANLHTHNVLQAPNVPFVLIHRGHPAVELLNFNADVLGYDAPRPIDGEWLRVSKGLLVFACDTIRRRCYRRTGLDP